MTFDCGFCPQQIAKFIGQDNRTDYGAIKPAFFYSSFGTDYSDLGDVAYWQRYFLKSEAHSRFPYISKTKSPAWMLMTSGSAIIYH